MLDLARGFGGADGGYNGRDTRNISQGSHRQWRRRLEQHGPHPFVGYSYQQHGVAHTQDSRGQLFPGYAGPPTSQRARPAGRKPRAYIEGVSTRRVDDFVKAPGCDGISNSQVPRICQELDEAVESFLGRSLDGQTYPYLRLDTLTQMVRASGRIVNVSVVMATAVNIDGQRKILGTGVGTSEHGTFCWHPCARSPLAA